MRKITLRLIILFLYTFCQFMQAEAAQATLSSKEDFSKISADEPILGDLNAPVELIIYSSFSCPHCTYLHNEVMPLIDRDYIKTGKVKYVHRSLAFDKVAYAGTVMAHCIPKEQYNDFVNLLFAKYNNWVSNDNYLEPLKKFGKIVGVTDEKFNACMKDESFEKSFLTKQHEALQQLQIKGAPFIIVNGDSYPGALDYKKLSKILDEAFNKTSTKKDLNKEQ